jgi:hypothetical protein
MIGFIEHFFTITINYSAIINLQNSLGQAPFSSYYARRLLAESESYITIDGQSASLSWCEHPYGAYDQIYITVRQLRIS